jgi:hypothetical protein
MQSATQNNQVRKLSNNVSGLEQQPATTMMILQITWKRLPCRWKKSIAWLWSRRSLSHAPLHLVARRRSCVSTFCGAIHLQPRRSSGAGRQPGAAVTFFFLPRKAGENTKFSGCFYKLILCICLDHPCMSACKPLWQNAYRTVMDIKITSFLYNTPFIGCLTHTEWICYEAQLIIHETKSFSDKVIYRPPDCGFSLGFGGLNWTCPKSSAKLYLTPINDVLLPCTS